MRRPSAQAPLSNPIVHERIPRNAPRSFFAALGAVLVASLTGCGPMIRDVSVTPRALPAPLADAIPARVGVFYTPAFRSARPQSDFDMLGTRYVWNHDLGAAALAGMQQALSASFAHVVELDRLPTPEHARDDLAAVLVLDEPRMYAAAPMHSVVSLFRQDIVFPVRLHSPSGEQVGAWQAAGMSNLGAHGPAFLQQEEWDRATLRSAVGALVASLHREPALAFLRPPPAAGSSAASGATDTAPTRRGAVVLRVDAGLPADDGIERRVASCLEPEVRPPPALAVPKPAGALRDALFPWLEPGVAPQAAPDIAVLLGTPRIHDRLTELGVSHLVLLSARDAERAETRGLGCFGGFGAGACFGVYEDKSGYVVELAVWDAAGRRLLGEGSADFTRRLGVLGLGLPIPYTTSNWSQSCEHMRAVVRNALSAAK